MEEQIIRHLDSKFKVRLEQAASTKGQIGFVVEANGDDLDQVTAQAEAMYGWAKATTAPGGDAFFKVKEGKDVAN